MVLLSRTEHKSEFVKEMSLYGTTYEICAYFEGKQTLAEIITKRIFQEMDKEEPALTIPVTKKT